MNEERYLKWDARFLALAELVAGWSKDPRRKVGAVIVRPDMSVASVGFNGFPSRMLDRGERYSNQESKRSRIVHAEINALLFARERVVGCTLYTWPYGSCDRCAVQLVQAGIGHVVFPVAPHDESPEGALMRAKAREYFLEAGVGIRWKEPAAPYPRSSEGEPTAADLDAVAEEEKQRRATIVGDSLASLAFGGTPFKCE